MLVDPFETVVIRGDRWKSFKSFLIMAGITAAAVATLHTGRNTLLALAGIAFFGGFGFISLFSTVRPPTLTIDGDGLRWRGLRSWHLSWSDIDRFRIMTLRRSSSVMIDYRPGKTESGVWARFLQPKGLSGVLWMAPVELHELLQDRLKALRAADPPPLTTGDPEPALKEPTTTFPWVSVALILVLCIVFAAELRFPVTPANNTLQPSVMTLAGFGGISRALLSGPGEWYRFVASAFLHANLAHLLGNCLALFLAGRLLEGLVGRGWFLGIYAVGAFAGDLGSLLFNVNNAVSVGASGAILALFAATYVCSFHFPWTAGRSRLQSGAFAILVPTLLNLGRTSGGLAIDVGDHLGGTLGGALLGLWLLRGWNSVSLKPPRQRLGWVVAGLGGVAATATIWPGMAEHAVFEKASMLVPNAVMPKDDRVVIQQAHNLLNRYPNDPRLHLADAIDDLSKGDAASAEKTARDGLKDPVLLHDLLAPTFEASLWQVLGEALAKQRRDGEAGEAYDKATTIDPSLATIDYDRAEMHFNQGALEPALAEASRFSQRFPRSSDGLELLGNIQFARSDIPDALTAYERLQTLQPSGPHRRIRGLAHFYAGDGQAALDDLQAAASAEPGFVYGLLWLGIVQQRQHVALTSTDRGHIGTGGDWPAPVMAMFSNAFNPAALKEVAEASPGKTGEDRVCEADFYTAEWQRNQGSEADAKAGFAKAVQECPSTFVETWMARAELSRTSGILRPRQ